MVTRYGVASGGWNTTASWSATDGGVPGASVPTEDDAVIVCAGVTIWFDVDQSAWVTGIAGLTIRGGATPAMLAFKNDADGTYYLRMKAGTTINGTTAGGKRGRLLLAGGTWDSPTDLPFGRKHIIEKLGTGSGYVIDATNLDIIAKCTQPALPYVETYGTKRTCTADAGTDRIDWGAAAPTAGTAVKIRSTGDLPGGIYANQTYYVRDISGNTFRLALKNADAQIVDITSAGTGTLSILLGYALGSATVNVDADVTGDAAWTTAAGHNVVALVDLAAATAYDQQRNLLTAIDTDTVILSGTVDSAQDPCARLVVVSRNVRIITNSTSSSSGAITFGSTTPTGSTLQCELRNVAGTGTTFYGNGVVSGSNVTVSGSVCGFTTGCSAVTNLTMSGTIVSCGTGVATLTGGTVSGVILGCTNGWATGSVTVYGGTMSGKICGCTNAITFANCVTITGEIFAGTAGVSGHSNYLAPTGALRNLNSGFSNALGFVSEGLIAGCLNGIDNSTGTVLGTITGSTYGVLYSSATLLGATLLQNDADVVWPENTYGYRASLNSPVQCVAYDHNVPSYGSLHALCLYDVAGALGQVKAWMPGGTVVSEAAPGTPPVTLTYAHKMTGQSDAMAVFLEFALNVIAGEICTVTIWEKCDANPSTFAVGPKWQICDPSYAFGDASGVLAEVAAQDAGDDTNWHTLNLSYTPMDNRQLILRCLASGASKLCHWMYKSGPTAAEIAAAAWTYEDRQLTA